MLSILITPEQDYRHIAPEVLGDLKGVVVQTLNVHQIGVTEDVAGGQQVVKDSNGDYLVSVKVLLEMLRVGGLAVAHEWAYDLAGEAFSFPPNWCEVVN